MDFASLRRILRCHIAIGAWRFEKTEGKGILVDDGCRKQGHSRLRGTNGDMLNSGTKGSNFYMRCGLHRFAGSFLKLNWMQTKKPNIRNWRIIRKTLIWKKAWDWTRFFLKNSGTFSSEFDRDVHRARLRKGAHTIEKGLSLPRVRPVFGRVKIAELLGDVEIAQQRGELERDVDIAQSVLRSYIEWHASRECFDMFVESLREAIPSKRDEPGLGGVIAEPDKISAEMAEQFDAVVLSRRSVRNFTNEVVPTTVIEDAIRVAWSSPSVCNRQPWAVAIVQSPDQVKRMLDLQAGNRGFEQTIANLLVVFADTKAFVEDYELYEPFVDAGIFSGSLVNALHARNVGSCCLNLCVSHTVAKRIVDALDAPSHFFPIMMIACGYGAQNCEVAMSTRGPSVVLKR